LFFECAKIQQKKLLILQHEKLLERLSEKSKEQKYGGCGVVHYPYFKLPLHLLGLAGRRVLAHKKSHRSAESLVREPVV
jgi:hypothetical protein